MKLTLSVQFDPFGASPKDIQQALVAAGIDPADIKIGTTRGPREPREAKTKTRTRKTAEAKESEA